MDNFDGKKFQNYGSEKKKIRKDTVSEQSRWKMFWKWIRHRPPNRWEKRPNLIRMKLQERVDGKDLTVTFVNHSTVLIQVGGLNILTDPIWSNRASPFKFAGPHRYREPGVLLKDLPPIDAVIISHNHYDHLDIDTLRQIQHKWHPQFFVGLKNKKLLSRHGLKNVFEMNWWDRVKLSPQVTLNAVPAQHFSGRSLHDTDRTLWCGYVLETPGGNIYFAGDTGMGKFVDLIAERWRDFRLALLPIGAFKPEWFMSRVHISPQEALQIHKRLNVKTSVGIHFGTFRLADDHQDEPLETIHKLLAAETPAPDFRVLEFGESARLKG